LAKILDEEPPPWPKRSSQEFQGWHCRDAIRVLKDRGIFAHPLLSVQHQQLRARYVIRGLESGGSLADVGRYVTFTANDGQQLDYLHSVESIAVNGIHGVVLSPELVRVDLLRKGRTYELLITRHELRSSGTGTRPQLETEVLFRGIHGRLELDLCGRDKPQAGQVSSSFFSLAGEPVIIPEFFLAAVRAATKGVNRNGCSHAHYLRKPRPARFENHEPNTPPNGNDQNSSSFSKAAEELAG
jgi:hypothetical protein